MAAIQARKLIEAPNLATLLQPLHSGQWVAFSHDYSKVLASGNSVANHLKKLSDEEKASDPIFYKVPDQIKIVITFPSKVTVLAMLDSGADICVFNMGYAVALGLELSQCEQVTVSGVEGMARDCYKTVLDLKPEGLPRITVPVLL